VLPAGNGRNIVIWQACVKVASFATECDESPNTHIDAGAEIKYSPSEFPGSLVGPVIDPRQPLFVVGISADDDCVWRNSRRWAQLHPNSRRDIQAGKIVHRRVISVETSRSGLAAFKSRATLHLENLALRDTNSPCFVAR